MPVTLRGGCARAFCSQSISASAARWCARTCGMSGWVPRPGVLMVPVSRYLAVPPSPSRGHGGRRARRLDGFVGRV
eukprot:6249827-Prorocentrum_lima.AAC.1